MSERNEKSNLVELDELFDYGEVSDTRVTPVFDAALPVQEALIRSLKDKGKVDIRYISKLSGEDLTSVTVKLAGSIFQNPETWCGDPLEGWEMADEYLSGNMFLKLKALNDVAKQFPGHFSANIRAIKPVVSVLGVSFDNIYFTLGSPWIPAKRLDIFIHKVLFGLASNTIPSYVKCSVDTRKWSIDSDLKSRLKGLLASYQTYGTRRQGALDIFEDSLNLRVVQVRTKTTIQGKDGQWRDAYVLDEYETALAREKQLKIEALFRKWIEGDEYSRKIIETAFNRKFGYTTHKRYKGDFLTEFPGLAEGLEPFSYQKDAIARIILSPNTLLAHDVGAGKTWVMIIAGMLLRRMGLSKKNLYVVPLAIVSQWVAMFTTLYPDADILVVNPESFEPDKRDEMWERICSEDHDAIIMAHSVFERIPMRRPLKRKKRDDDGKEGNAQYKMLGRFEDMQVNTLFIDEIHNYKNISIKTRINRVYGIRHVGSYTCDDVMAKVRSVQKANGGKRVIIATGTPITNSITDLYVWQSMLQHPELKFLGIDTFDRWVGTFSERVSEYEVGVDIKSLRWTTRFKSFHNLPELAALLSQVTDFHRIKGLAGIPTFDGYTDIEVSMSEVQRLVFDDLSDRTERIHKHKVSLKDDNMLAVTTDGRKTALDVRLYDEDFTCNTPDKVALCSRCVHEVYRDGQEAKTTQLVYCDISTPKQGFNVYQALKDKMVSLGIPASEVAFVHNYQSDKRREKLARQMATGEIRVLIGSTFKLGTGANYQTRLIAVHHLDVPWRPADMIQREGRILRPGNTNSKVKIFRYFTEGSFDAYSWQLLESKQHLIHQLMSGFVLFRECADLAATVLNYGEIKALCVEDPAVQERIKIANEICRVALRQTGRTEERLALKTELDGIPKALDVLARQIAIVEADSLSLTQYGEERMSAEEREAWGQRVLDAINAGARGEVHGGLPGRRGFKLAIPESIDLERPEITVSRTGTYTVKLGDKATGVLARVDNRLARLADDLKELRAQAEALRTKQAQIIDDLSQEDPFDAELAKLQAKLKKLDKQLGLGKH
jgi:N12 class adenine-specific DNA methylase